MALPLLFVIGGALFRAATPTIAKYLGKQGLKQITKNSVKSSIKKYGSPKTISSIPKAAKIRTSTVKIKPQLSNAKEAAKKVIDKRLPNNKSLSVIKPKPKSKLINGKVITAATTVASGATLLAKDDKKGEASAKTKKGKVDAGLQEALKKKARDAKNKKMNDIEKSTRGQKSKSKSTTATTTMTFGKAFRAAKDAGKKEFTYKGKKYHTRTKDEDKKATANPPIPKSRPKTEKKVEKKIEKKVDAPLKKVQKNITAGKNTGFGPKGNIFPTSPEERKELMKKYGGTGSEAAKNSKVGKQGNRKGIGRA